jgi:hypothetical protein
VKGDQGSIAPLGIGLAAILMATVFTVVCANSLYILRQRLTASAEFAALAEARFATPASDFLSTSDYPASYFVQGDSSVDNRTFEVTICSEWVAPVPLLEDLGEVLVCGRGAARAG